MWGFGVTRRRLRFVSDWTLPSSRLFVSPFESSASHLSLGPPFSRHHLSRWLRPTVKHFAGKKTGQTSAPPDSTYFTPQKRQGAGPKPRKMSSQIFRCILFFFCPYFQIKRLHLKWPAPD